MEGYLTLFRDNVNKICDSWNKTLNVSEALVVYCCTYRQYTDIRASTAIISPTS